MKKINLEKIIKSNSPAIYENQTRRDGWTKTQVKNICLEFGKQLLKLASENAYCNHEFDGAHGCEYEVNKQSIIKTIKQIE